MKQLLHFFEDHLMIWIFIIFYVFDIHEAKVSYFDAAGEHGGAGDCSFAVVDDIFIINMVVVLLLAMFVFLVFRVADMLWFFALHFVSYLIWTARNTHCSFKPSLVRRCIVPALRINQKIFIVLIALTKPTELMSCINRSQKLIQVAVVMGVFNDHGVYDYTKDK